MTRSEWVMQQLCTKNNILSSLGIFAILVYSFYEEPKPLVIGVCFAAFFLITSWQMIATMIFVSIIVTAVCAVLPFLAPVAFVIMVFLFFARIGFVIKNWRAVLAGLMVYGLAAILMFRMEWMYRAENFVYVNVLAPVMSFVPKSAFGFLANPNLFLHISYIMAFVTMVAFFYQMLLYWLYRNGYTASGALNIMGSIPLVIIALVLPFLKAASFDGPTADGVSGGVTHDGAFAPEGAHDGFVHDGMAHDGIVQHDGMAHDGIAHDGVRAPSGYHHVNDYTRMAPDGHLEHVRGYIRSNPDGIIENNLSYNGGHGPHGSYESANHGTAWGSSRSAEEAAGDWTDFKDVPDVIDVGALSGTARSTAVFSPRKHIVSTLMMVYFMAFLGVSCVLYITLRYR